VLRKLVKPEETVTSSASEPTFSVNPREPKAATLVFSAIKSISCALTSENENIRNLNDPSTSPIVDQVAHPGVRSETESASTSASSLTSGQNAFTLLMMKGKRKKTS
jgi:hypothetical protein